MGLGEDLDEVVIAFVHGRDPRIIDGHQPRIEYEVPAAQAERPQIGERP
jgi:hypothetical protein